MSSDGYAVKVERICKTYEIHQSPARRLLRLVWPYAKGGTPFHALKEVSFLLPRGGFLGIIGRNGSGKSTLLQLITGIMNPTSGTVEIHGRVGALLELGAGFSPEFTGRENARLNAQILGVGGAQFEALLPEIEQFAGIGQFIDEPVKTYSSGMFVRLAFAIQACIDPDVLIVDEALAVGDVFFRLRCYERLARLRRKGCSIILVTHSMEDVLHHCDQVILLDKGECIYHGDPAHAVNRYYALGRSDNDNPRLADGIGPGEKPLGADGGANGADTEAFPSWPADGVVALAQHEQVVDGVARAIRATVVDAAGNPRRAFQQGEVATILVEFEAAGSLGTPCAGMVLRTDKGVILHGKHTAQCEARVPGAVGKGQLIQALHKVELEVAPGEYVLDLGLASWPGEVYEARSRLSMAEMEGSARRHCVVPGAISIAVFPRSGMGFNAQPFYGLARLQSTSQLWVKRE